MKKLAITLLFLIIPRLLFAGGWSGNGGSSSVDVNNIWFAGESSIPYCVIASNSPFSVPAYQQMIRMNSDKWKSFFTKYEMSNEIIGNNQFLLLLDKVSRKISLDFKPLSFAECENVVKYCHPNHTNEDKCYDELRSKVLFLFGDANSVINKYLEINGPSLGVALRTDYNHATYQTGGIVWINPKFENVLSPGWSQYSHILLHEMGHVLGMKHDSCWIMSSNIKNHFSPFWLGELETIEAKSWPYSFIKGEQVIFSDLYVELPNAKRGFRPNSFIDNKILNLLSFSLENSHQVRGSITESSFNFINIKIEIEETNTGKIHYLSGSLESVFSLDQTLVPELVTFTHLKNKNDDRPPMLRKINLMSGFVNTYLQGVLEWNGKYIPATLARDKGVILSIFFPDVNKWMKIGNQFGDSK